MGELQTKKSIAEIRHEAMRERVELSCAFLEIPVVPEYFTDANKRSKLYKDVASLRERLKKPEKAKKADNKDDELITLTLDFDGVKFYIPEYKDIDINAIISEGLRFQKDETICQIPEIIVKFKRYKQTGTRSITQNLADISNGLRPVNKSVSSVIFEPKEMKYPASFEDAVSNLEINFSKRVASYFNFKLNFSALAKTAFKKIFERAISGQKLLQGSVVI